MIAPLNCCSTTLSYSNDTTLCKKCKTVFYTKEDNLLCIIISTKKSAYQINLKNEEIIKFYAKNHELAQGNIPYFEPDLSNIKALINKLSIYSSFS